MLRDYQQKAIAEIRQAYSEGYRRSLLWLATGAGKTVIFCDVVKSAVARGKKAIIVVKGRKLVDQASERLNREGVVHGVMMAKHYNYRPHLPVQVCSIDTLIARGLRPPADIIIVDEAHLASGDGYRTVLANYSRSFVLAVTATPYVDGGLRHVADVIVQPIKMMDLIAQGYLCPFRYFAPTQPDLKDVQVSSTTNDYVTAQLEIAMTRNQLTGKIVEHYIRIARGAPAICFNVNIRHSKMLCDQFNSQGVRAEHLDAKTPEDEREAIFKRSQSGETEVICNVGVLGVGVDLPWLKAIILARPTKSKNLFIQQAGRGTRIYPGKENCILLDHAGNISRHGLPTDEVPVDLNGKEKKERMEPMESKICRGCFAVYRGPKCPECGEVNSDPRSLPSETNDSLNELTNIEPDPIKRAHIQFQVRAKTTGRKLAWAHYQLLNQFGLELCRPYLPLWFIRKQEEDPFTKSPFKGVKAQLFR